MGTAQDRQYFINFRRFWHNAIRGEDKAMQFQQNYEKSLNDLKLFSEVPKLFNELKISGLEVGLITNGPTAHQQDKIRQLRLTQFIREELIFISDQVGIAKPNPDIFHRPQRK